MITGQSHVLYRAQRAILNARRKDDVVRIFGTPEAAYEIMWFARLFPLETNEVASKLRSEAATFTTRRAYAKQILSGGSTTQFSFRKGLKPRDYQRTAAELVWSQGGLLIADELGLGKTVTTAAALTRGKRMMPALIVVPAHLQQQWINEMVRFLPNARVHKIKQLERYTFPQFRLCGKCKVWVEQRMIRNTAMSMQTCKACGFVMEGETKPVNILVTSYAKLAEWNDQLPELKTVVFDEIAELRRSQSSKYKAASQIARRCQYRIGLSGTPIHNMGGEIFNVMDCLRPGELGSKSGFRDQWCGYGGAGKEPPLLDPKAFNDYMTESNMMIRRTREDVGIQLPKHTRVVQPVESDLKALQSVEGKAAELAKIILNDTGSRKGEATMQIESLLRQATGIAKAPYVAAFVDMLVSNDRPVILFGYHHAVYDIWMQLLHEHNPVMFTGKESPEKKEHAKQMFLSGQTNLMICSIESGAGTDGLQMRCSTGVIGELPWSPSPIKQAIGRYNRPGQTKPCYSYLMVSEFGLDPVMSEVLGLKSEQAELLIGEKDRSHEMLRGIDHAKHIEELAKQFIR